MTTYILGISAYYHDSAAALLKEGEIIAATQEERFTRKKHDPLPFNQHHESHAASAFFPSPYNKAAVLCLDGVGEWATSSVGWAMETH